MAHIPVAADLPGIRGLFAFRPETAAPMNELVEILLRGPSSLSPGERELIATYVSAQNECQYCHSIHGAIAAAHLSRPHLGAQSLEESEVLVDRVRRAPGDAAISPKLKALLVIAGKVQKGGRRVTDSDVAAARREGATDLEIHDAVLIAAAFCMYNRYVDGLATAIPDDPAWYRERGRKVAEIGYVASSRQYIAAHQPPSSGDAHAAKAQA